MSKDNNIDKEPWFSVRSLFFDEENGSYEERTILISATDHDDAIEQAEKEAKQYSASIGGIIYVGYSDSFHIFGEEIKSGTEIFSLIRKTDLAADEYINRFLDSGMENRQVKSVKE